MSDISGYYYFIFSGGPLKRTETVREGGVCLNFHSITFTYGTDLFVVPFNIQNKSRLSEGHRAIRESK